MYSDKNERNWEYSLEGYCEGDTALLRFVQSFKPDPF